jgi:hypothetical protein
MKQQMLLRQNKTSESDKSFCTEDKTSESDDCCCAGAKEGYCQWSNDVCFAEDKTSESKYCSNDGAKEGYSLRRMLLLLK